MLFAVDVTWMDYIRNRLLGVTFFRCACITLYCGAGRVPWWFPSPLFLHFQGVTNVWGRWHCVYTAILYLICLHMLCSCTSFNKFYQNWQTLLLFKWLWQSYRKIGIQFIRHVFLIKESLRKSGFNFFINTT